MAGQASAATAPFGHRVPPANRRTRPLAVRLCGYTDPSTARPERLRSADSGDEAAERDRSSQRAECEVPQRAREDERGSIPAGATHVANSTRRAAGIQGGRIGRDQRDGACRDRTGDTSDRRTGNWCHQQHLGAIAGPVCGVTPPRLGVTGRCRRRSCVALFWRHTPSPPSGWRLAAANLDDGGRERGDAASGPEQLCEKRAQPVRPRSDKAQGLWWTVSREPVWHGRRHPPGECARTRSAAATRASAMPKARVCISGFAPTRSALAWQRDRWRD